jgi:hypothetical protein
MNKREAIIGVVALLLMVLSLFDYSRVTRQDFAHGSSVQSVSIDGASLVSIGLGIAIILSVRSFSREIGRICSRIGLPAKLPKVAYEWLPLSLVPFLIVGYRYTYNTVGNGDVTVTSGFGNSPSKIVMLVLLCVLIYVAKLRGRLKEIDAKV